MLTCTFVESGLYVAQPAATHFAVVQKHLAHVQPSYCCNSKHCIIQEAVVQMQLIDRLCFCRCWALEAPPPWHIFAAGGDCQG
jgi:uncharacterized ferritin-like protein (DUF455 family)